MLRNHYTPDAICCAMGLVQFVEHDLPKPALRLLLKPSFDSEACITLTGPRSLPQLSVVVLLDRLWLLDFPITNLPNQCEVHSIESDTFEHQVAMFSKALAAERQQDKLMIFLDGMPVESCLIDDGQLNRFGGQPYCPETCTFVSTIIELAWTTCGDPLLRNAMARCGRYVGFRPALLPEPPKKPTSHLLVLGSPESREAYFLRLRQPEILAERVFQADIAATRPGWGEDET